MVAVIGLGLFGITCARLLAEAGMQVVAFDSRESIGGNSACKIDESTGIEIHTYGSHIFHTGISAVYDFVRRFTDLNGYFHKCIACHNGKHYLFPVGLHLINKFFGVELTPCEVDGFMAKSNRKEMIFDAFFRGYTSKQWGVPPEQVPVGVIERLPVRTSYDINYFHDCIQGIPADGYMAMFSKMIDHPNITLQLNTKVVLKANRFWTMDGVLPVCPTIYSGPIDKLFSYRYGQLPWRSLRFDNAVLDVNDYQGTSIVNYSDLDVPYTRIHEYKHYHPEWKDVMVRDKTIICKEFPVEWRIGLEPFYPIDTPDSRILYAKYKADVDKIPWLTVGGRLGSYKYINMDEAIKAGMETVKLYA